MSHELIPILDLELVDFASYDATQREQVLQALQTMLGSAAGFIAPHSDFWKKWTRLPTLGGYQLLLDALSPHVALALALGLIDAADQRNRTLPEQPIRLRLVLAYGTVHPVGDSWSGQVLHELHELRACPELIAAEQRLWAEQRRTGALLATIPFYIQWRQSDQTQPVLESISWTDLTVRSAAATPLKAKHLHRQPTLAPPPTTAPAPVPPAPSQAPSPSQDNSIPQSTDSSSHALPPKPPPADQASQVSKREKVASAVSFGILFYASLFGGIPNAALLSWKTMCVLSAILVGVGLICTQTALRKLFPKLTPLVWPSLLGGIAAIWSFSAISSMISPPKPGHLTAVITVLDPGGRPVLDADVRAPIGQISQTTGGYRLLVESIDIPQTSFEVRAHSHGSAGSTRIDPRRPLPLVATIQLRPIKPVRPELYTLRLTVLDPDHLTTQEATVTSAFGEVKKTASGWEISIASSLAPEVPFTIHAETTAGLRGSVTVKLAEQAIIPLTIQLKTVTTTIKGTLEASDGTPIADREVWIESFESEATRTDRFGRFQLKTTKPPNHHIQICVSRPGRAPYRQIQVVKDAAAIVLPP